MSEPQEEGLSRTNKNVSAQESLDKERSYENSVDNMNVGNQEMLDKDFMRTHMIRIQPAPGSRGPGSNHEL